MFRTCKFTKYMYVHNFIICSSKADFAMCKVVHYSYLKTLNANILLNIICMNVKHSFMYKANYLIFKVYTLKY